MTFFVPSEVTMRAILFIWSIAGIIIGLMGSWRAPASYRHDYFIAFLICTVLFAVIGNRLHRQYGRDNDERPSGKETH